MKEKILFWIPRILAIIAIGFMMMFSLDCFGMGGKDVLVCLFMHNIPALIIVAVLVIAWKWELPGGVLFILVSFAGSIYFDGFSGNWGVLPIMAPFLITGILFISHYYLYLRRIQQESNPS